ncbi:MAG: sigma-54-dependent Fis family transcriptional regulator [Planctomycetes bacterium]|nr:sigma-54-dependent Fis family transcriptional regulator [Planctomycetota bacterium]
MSVRVTVLVVDDEPFVRESLVEMVGGEPGLRAVAAEDPVQALEIVGREQVDVVVADLQMPGGGALRLLGELQRSSSGVPVIVITGVGTIASAVEAMKAGAFDFVQKPVEPDQLLLLVARALEHGRLVRDVQILREAAGGTPRALVGESAAMRRIRDLLAQVARTDSTVLVTGESGTGKELAAEAIHYNSPRSRGNLVRVNCAAIPDSLFESEFFGHRRGAFSGAVSDRRGRFAEAEGGTLVLDEISTLRPEMQAKLLRVLESGEYQVVGESVTRTADVRIVAVSNESLVERVDAGTFRGDLYYRLAIFPIEMPPLRDRRDDIGPLAAHLVTRLRGRGDDAVAPLSSDVVEVLAAHHWPGNVRELRNVLERALILAGDAAPTREVFAAILESSVKHDPEARGHALHLRSRLEETERELVRRALDETGGRRKDAAALLGIDPRNLAYYLRKHGLSDPAPS